PRPHRLLLGRPRTHLHPPRHHPPHPLLPLRPDTLDGPRPHDRPQPHRQPTPLRRDEPLTPPSPRRSGGRGPGDRGPPLYFPRAKGPAHTVATTMATRERGLETDPVDASSFRPPAVAHPIGPGKREVDLYIRTYTTLLQSSGAIGVSSL